MDEFIADVNPIILSFAGIVVPLILAVINGVAWPSSVKALVSAVVSLGIGAGLGYLMDMRGTEALLTSAVAVYLTVQVTYGGFYKPTGITDSVERSIAPRGPEGA